MKDLITYLECCPAGASTPANTLGMGNPGQLSPDTLTEPVGGIEKTAKALKQNDHKKKKKFKSLSESIFDDDLVTRDISKFGSMFKLDSVEIKEKVLKPGPLNHGIPTMFDTNLKIGDLYKTTLLSKDTGIHVTKDPNTIAKALDKIICDTKITPEFLKMTLFDFGRMLCRENRRYYSGTLLRDSYLNMSADVYAFDKRDNYDNLVLDTDVIRIEFFHITLTYKRK